MKATQVSEPRQDQDEMLLLADYGWYDRYQLRLVNVLTILLVAGPLTMIAVLLAAGELERLWGTIPFEVLGLAVWILMYRKMVRLAFQVLVYGCWACAINALLVTHGLTGTTTGLLVVTLAFAGWLVGPTAAIILTAATPPVLYLIAYLEVTGWPITIVAKITSYQRAMLLSMAMLAAGALGYFGAISLRERLNRLNKSQRDLGNRLAELQAIGEELRRSQNRFENLFRSSPSASVIANPAGLILDCNQLFEQMVGRPREEVIGCTSADFGIWEHPENRQHAYELIARDNSLNSFEADWLTPAGESRTALIFGTPLELNLERCNLFHIVDITERKKLEQAREESEARARSLVEVAFDGVMTHDHGLIIEANQRFAQLFGYDNPDELIGQNDIERLVTPDSAATLRAHIAAGRTSQPIEGTGIRKDGSTFIGETQSCKTTYHGRTVITIAVRDITARKLAEDEIRNLAFYDPLTRLPNRRLLLDRLHQALASNTRSGRHGALLLIDLDNFKTLNDTLGHDMGDLLLQQVAQRLSTCIRVGDTVARLGGDEFVVMLQDLSENAEEAATQTESVGEKTLQSLSQPYRLLGYENHSTPSIGITLFGGQQHAIEDLLKQADLAMYQSKTAGRNTMRFFDPEMQTKVTNRAAMEVDLREALRQQQFILQYQPQVVGDGRITGAEVLMRWQHPQRGLVPPIDFIPLAEETGLILPLGQWVLETACVQLAKWANHPEMAALNLSVNVSANQLHQVDFVDQVLAVLRSTGANPHRLKLELTESLLVSNVENTIVKMTALKAQGVGFSLDDFGTGYSSLTYLKRLPLDQLKIDQGFVRDILIDPNDAAIAKMVVALAESLGLSVIAEGVEIESQRSFLASQGCHAYQGYLFSRPLPLDKFEELAKRV